MEKRQMDEWAKRVLKAIGTQDALSASRKREYYASIARFPMNMPSYWDGGSKDYYSFVKLSTLQHVNLPSNHPAYEPGKPYTMVAMPDDCLIVQTGIFCGKPAHAHFYVKDLAQIGGRA